MATQKSGYTYESGYGSFLGMATPTRETMISVAGPFNGSNINNSEEYRYQQSVYNTQVLNNPMWDPYYKSLQGFTAVGGDSRRFTANNVASWSPGGYGGGYFANMNQFTDFMVNSAQANRTTGISSWQYAYTGAYIADQNKTFYNISDYGARELGLYDQIQQGMAQEQAAYQQQVEAQAKAQEEARIAAQQKADAAYIANKAKTGIVTERTTLAGKSRRGGVAGLGVTEDKALGSATILGA